MKVLLFLIIFIGFSVLVGCQPVGEVAKLSSLNRAPTVTFTSTLEIDLSNHTAYSLTGTCSENGQDVTITGAINATTVCAFGVWSQTIDFSSYPDGLIQIFADHKNTHGFPAYQANTSLIKNSTLSIATISPSAGALAGGTLVTITGRNFRSGATVDLDGNSCSGISILSSTVLTCTTPAHPPGIVGLTITNLTGASATKTNAYTYQGAPTVTSVSPTAGALTGGTLVTITGLGFLPGATVDFGGSPCTGVNISNSTTLTCTTSGHAPGVVDVSVTNTDTQTGTGVALYTYQAAPSVTAITPNTGSATGGTLVTITGSNFLVGASVDLGGASCIGPIVVDSSTITCTTSARTEGIVNVKVTNTDAQEGTLTNSFAYGYTTINVNLSGKLPESTGLTIKNNTTGETLALNDNGTTSFLNAWAGASNYSVSILTQPMNNTCFISGGSGIIPSASPITVTINCTPTTYRLGGIVTGLDAGETITIKGNNTLGTDTNQETYTGIGADLYYELPEERYSGRYYSLSIVSSSPTKYCTFTDSTKKEGILSGNLSDANITCTSRTVGNCSNQTSELWGTNNQVYSVVCDGNDNLFIGGSFSYIGPNTGKGLILDINGNLPFIPPAKINGTVNSVISDGKGGWFIGGDFTKVGNTTRNRIAHLFSDLTLDQNFNPNADYTINSLFLNGETLFVGGQFNNIAGQARSRLAKISSITGVIDSSFNANISSGTVYIIILSGSDLFIGGSFTTVGGQTRNNIAKISSTTGAVDLSFNPNANNSVQSLILDNSNLYVGGWFTNIGTATRTAFARISTSTGQADSFDLAISGGGPSRIHSAIKSGNSIYIAGSFTSAGGQGRQNFAKVSTTTALAESLIISFSSYIKTMALSDGNLYFGGQFTTVNAQTRTKIAKVNEATGVLDSTFNPYISMLDMSLDSLTTLAVNGNHIFIGGDIVTTGGITRSGLAKLSTSTGEVIASFNPVYSNNSISSLILSMGGIYAGGSFTYIGGKTRNRIARLSTTTGLADNFNPNLDNTVSAMVLSGTDLYVGGSFTNIGGETRNRIAAIDTTTGSATSWNPNANGSVTALALDGSTLYAGGGFTTIGIDTRNHAAAIDTLTGSPTSWAPDVNNYVYSILVSGPNVYLGGQFTTVNTVPRNHLAKVSTSGTLESFNPNVGQTIMAMVLDGTNLYIAGQNISTVNALSRKGIARISTTTGLPDSFGTNATAASIDSLYLSGNNLFVGGYFNSIGGQVRNYLGVVPTDLDGLIP